MVVQLPPSLSKLIQRLVSADLHDRLPGTGLAADTLSDAEISRTITAGSLLALSSDFEDRALAYDIVTRAVGRSGQPPPEIIKGVELVLARLGNFPGRELLRRRHKDQLLETRGANLVRFEATMRRVENTIEDAAGRAVTVTDFQFDALDLFRADNTVSLSAPTSAGKSFILALHVVRRLKAKPYSCIIYLVPTRALIRQVIVAVRTEASRSGLEDLAIRSIPSPIRRDAAAQGVVYVLTQERLLSLLHAESPVGEVWVDLLIADEAQGIADPGRGVILHSAVDEVVHRFPSAEVIFASPLTRNPEYLLGLFGRSGGTRYVERQSPVAQNLILVRFGSGRNASFELIRSNETVSLGTRTLDRDLGALGALQRRAHFAASIAAKDGCCLVYANGARDAEKLAEHIASETKPANTEDREILEFIEYLEEHVHKDYGLIAVLRKRIAFHYGSMPGNVRAGVEELCKKGKFRFVCCTSTLLQGINLPARDVVIENPKRGSTKPMRRADFLNLSGRAGRLTREFHGNVWCLSPDQWEEPSFKGAPLQTIESALEHTVRDGGMSVRKVLEDAGTAELDPSAVATISRVYTDYLFKRRSVDLLALCPPENQAAWQETLGRVQAMETHLPGAVYARNYSILPSRLEELYVRMAKEPDPTMLMPIQPNRPGTNGRLWQAMEMQERVLEKNENNSFRHLYHLAKDWVHGVPLGRIIANSLDYGRRTDPEFNERDAIYRTIEEIERDIRFRIAKNFRAYNDVLAIVLLHAGLDDEAQHIIPFQLFLESGGSNPVFLALTSLGLSRTSALLLRRRIAFSQTVTPEQCLRSLKRINPELLKLPPFCVRELAAITGRKLPNG